MGTSQDFPSFSVVINTYNRAEGLRHTIMALLQLDYPRFEIVVVNGPSTDHTTQVLAKFPDRIKVLDCPVRNLSISRNIGIAAAAGELVAFIDDDALPEPEWLRQLAAGYGDPKVGATGGKVYDHTGYNFQYQYSTADRLGNAQWQLSEPTPELNCPGSTRFPYLQGTNTSFRRSALIEIGGFDEEFEFYLDETDVCLRMGDAGYLVRQLPDAYVHHKFLPSHIRDENRITKYRYPVVKNKIYFSLKNGRGVAPLRDIIVDALKFAISHQDDVEYHIAHGNLPESSRQMYTDEIEKALEDGLQRGLAPGRKFITQDTLNKHSRPFLQALNEDEVARLSRRRTVVLVSKDYPPGQAGGIATFNKDLAVALAAQGSNVHVIAESHDINRVDLEEGVWVHRLVMRPLDHSAPALQRGIPPQIWQWSAIALEETHRIASHHTVHVVETPIWDCQGAAFLLHGEWPLVVSLQTSLLFWLESHPELSSDPQWMACFGTPMLNLERELLMECDAARSISAAIGSDIERAYRFNFAKGQAVVAHLGMVDVPYRATTPNVGTALTVLFVGRLEHRKGIDVLLQAVPLILEKTTNVIFRIIGDDTIPGPEGIPYRQMFERSDAGRRLGSYVRFEGKADDAALIQAYADCDIFTSPSRYESFGLIFLEAMRAGKPVIGCLAGGMPEIIEHEGNGLLMPPGDALALAQAILRLLESSDLRKKWGRRGRQIFEERFTADKMAINSKAVFDAAILRYQHSHGISPIPPAGGDNSMEVPVVAAPAKALRVSFVTGICIANDAISNAVCDEFKALKHYGVHELCIFTYQCTDTVLPHRQVGTVADIINDSHFQASDLVVFHFGIYYPLFNLLPLIPQHIKKLVVFHNITPRELVSAEQQETIDKSFVQMANISWADHVVCDSATNLKVLRDAGINTPATVLHLSARITAPCPGQKPSFGDNTVRIAFIGRFVTSKGPHELLAAVRQALASTADLRFEIDLIGNLAISDAAMVEMLSSEAVKLQQEFYGRIAARIHGNASDAQKEILLARADLFVLPTRHEGFCVPILEAFASGCRVIVYENSNTPAISGGLATLVPTGDVAGLALAIAEDSKRVLTANWRGVGPDSYRAYAENTRNYAAQFTPEVTEARFARFVIEWLNNGSVPHEFITGACTNNLRLPVKNVSVVSASYLLNRPHLADNLPAEILLGDSEPCLGEGWLSPENWPPRLRHFGKHARVFLAKPRGGNARLQISAFCSNKSIGQKPVVLTVSLWGQPIGVFDFTREDWMNAEMELPKDCGYPFLNIELSVDRTWVPDSYNHDGDVRELGLAVRSITIVDDHAAPANSPRTIQPPTRRKKIVFWVPESHSTYGLNFGGYPPMGLLILASIAREKGLDVAFVDSENEHLSLEDTKRVLVVHAPDILAFSMSTPYVRIFNRQLPELRECLPATFFLTGGPHPSARKEKIFDDVPCIDAAIYGEGEIAFSNFIDYLADNIPISQVPSLIYKDNNNNVTLTDKAPPITDLDSIHLPAYDLIKHLIDRYPATFPTLAKPSFSVMATRGCPYQCTYCSNAVFGTSIRMRSIDNVVSEVEYLINNLGVHEIFFQDDTLNCYPEYFINLCNRLIEKKLNDNAVFKVVFRADKKLVTKELLEVAKKAGIWTIYYGVESGDPDMLRRIQKGITLDEIKRAFLLTRQAGIKSRAMLMIGNIGENKETITKSFELLTELLPDTFCFSIAYPFPETKFYNQVIENGLMYEHRDFVDEHYPWRGISRTVEMDREEIRLAKDDMERNVLAFLHSEEGLKRIHRQYEELGREDLWDENMYYHENPVLWTDYEMLNSHVLASYRFIRDRLNYKIMLGIEDFGLGEGWLSPENWPPNLRHFGYRARVFLKKPETDNAVLTISAYSGYLDILNDNVTFTISTKGHVIHRQLFVKNEWITISANLPIQSDMDSFLFLEFAVDKTWCPHDYLNNGDHRQLGLAVSMISIGTADYCGQSKESHSELHTAEEMQPCPIAARKKVVFWLPESHSTYGMKLGVYPPTGLLILASIARDKGFEVAYVDSENEPLSFEETLRTIKAHSPDVLAFSLTTPYVRIFNQQLPALRKELPTTVFIAGGPHPSARREDIFNDVPFVDLAVYGEGEIAFSRFLDHLLGNISLDQVPSLLYRGVNGLPALTAQAPIIQDLDSIPYPAYDLVQHLIAKYPATFPSRAKPSIHIMATRGCPYKCTYCSNAVFGASIRMRSAEHVIREIEYLVDNLGVREVFFQDDTLNCSPDYFFSLCNLLIARGLNRKAMYKVVFRANKTLVSPELLAKAKEAGVWMIFYGVESGDPEMLRRICKGITLDELKRAFLLTRQAGIKTHASLMIGNLGETRETIAKSYDLLTEILPDTFCFSIAYPFPGTRFYDLVIEQNLMYPHTDFVADRYPWIGISRTEALDKDEIRYEKEVVQLKTIDYLASEQGILRIHKQYSDAGREDLWQENLYFHRNPVLWTDYDVLSTNMLLSYSFLREKLDCQILPGVRDYGLGEGWLTIENWPPKLRHFRQHARVFLRKPYSNFATLRIKAYSGYPEIKNRGILLTVSVWGEQISELLFTNHNWTVFEVRFSAAHIAQPFVSVEFYVNNTWCPHLLYNNEDRRLLGLAVSEISILPFV